MTCCGGPSLMPSRRRADDFKALHQGFAHGVVGVLTPMEMKPPPTKRCPRMVSPLPLPLRTRSLRSAGLRTTRRRRSLARTLPLRNVPFRIVRSWLPSKAGLVGDLRTRPVEDEGAGVLHLRQRLGRRVGVGERGSANFTTRSRAPFTASRTFQRLSTVTVSMGSIPYAAGSSMAALTPY